MHFKDLQLFSCLGLCLRIKLWLCICLIPSVFAGDPCASQPWRDLHHQSRGWIPAMHSRYVVLPVSCSLTCNRFLNPAISGACFWSLRIWFAKCGMVLCCCSLCSCLSGVFLANRNHDWCVIGFGAGVNRWEAGRRATTGMLLRI